MNPIVRKLKKIPFVLQSYVPFQVLDDKTYLKLTFEGLMGQKLHWDNPKTFNEKLQVLKLVQTGEPFTSLVDKAAAKGEAEKILSRDFIVPTLRVYKNTSEINPEELPERYVLKTTHDSGGVWIITPDNPYTPEIARQIEESLSSKYYLQWREKVYQEVEPQIIAEEFLEDNIKDYKFFCFDGQPEVVLVCSDRKNGLKEDFMDAEWNWLELVRTRHPRSEQKPPRPAHFDVMLEAARKLSKGFPFVRVDLFECNNKVYFGEMTFIPACGFEGFTPEGWDRKLGDKIDLSKAGSVKKQ